MLSKKHPLGVAFGLQTDPKKGSRNDKNGQQKQDKQKYNFWK